MATQLFLTDTVADTHLGTDNLNLLSSAVGWTSRALSTSRGSGVVASDNVATVTGATAGVTITKTSPLEWISPPVSADVTISGTITLNIWSSESNMSANVAINARIEVLRANATATRNSNTIATIATTARVTEVAVTTRAADNFTVTPTSTTVNRGDRIRVIVFGDDVGTMATGFTFNIGYSGTSAAADGDSYVSFTENFSFENPPGVLDQTSQSDFWTWGITSSVEKLGQAFVAQSSSLTEVKAWLYKNGTPSDNVVVEIRTDDGSGQPSGTVVSTVATVAAASLTTTAAQFTWSTSITLTASQTYWLVLGRSGALDASNTYSARASTGSVSGWTNLLRYATGTWGLVSSALTVRFGFSGSTSTLYLTDTASAVATASVDLEAWTSRGSAKQTGVLNTATGWTAPVQLTQTAGGTVMDWFTKRLNAFTLTGMAVANLYADESAGAANASLRCEIARVENDGTSPTVWSSWCIAPTGTDNGEIGTVSSSPRTAYVSGDDLAISDGQRLRIRIYVDDMSAAAMAAGGAQVTFHYNRPTAALQGDTYVTLAQTVTEFGGGTTYTKAGYGRESA